MNIKDYFLNTRFEEFYQNPDVVLVAFTLIVFAVVFSTLMRVFSLKDKKAAVFVISAVISFTFAMYFRDLTSWLATFNALLYIAVALVIIFILFPFSKFLRKQFKNY